MSIKKFNPTRLLKLRDSLEEVLLKVSEENLEKMKNLKEILEKKKKMNSKGDKNDLD